MHARSPIALTFFNECRETILRQVIRVIVRCRFALLQLGAHERDGDDREYNHCCRGRNERHRERGVLLLSV